MARNITVVTIVAIVAISTSAAVALGATAEGPETAMAQQTPTATPGGQTPTTTPGGGDQTASITFFEQSTNGTSLTIQRVVVPEGGFVVIHNATLAAGGGTPNGAGTPQYTPGEVLGNSTYLAPGVHQGVTVMLDERLDTPAGERKVVIAMLHRDTNDNRQFDFPQADDPYVQNGQPVTDAANVTGTDPTR